MRYSRMSEESTKKRSGGGKGGIAIVIVLALAAAVYFIGAAKVGAFISDKVITPVMLWVTGGERAETDEPENISAAEDSGASEDAGEAAATVSFDDKTAYMLQIGVFNDTANAEKLAGEMKKKGCAGYIYEDDGNRVFISAYPKKEDAEDVKNRIADEYDMDTTLYEFSAEGVSIAVSTEPETVSRIEETVTAINGHADAVLKISQGFDKGDMTAAEAVEAIETLNESAGTNKELFDSYAQRTDNALITALFEYYEGACTALTAPREDMSGAELSSQLKTAYIEMLVLYQKLTDSAV